MVVVVVVVQLGDGSFLGDGAGLRLLFEERLRWATFGGELGDETVGGCC